MAKKLKADLERELSVLQANYDNSEKFLTQYTYDDKLTFTQRIKQREQEALNQIKGIVQDCADRTGRIPQFREISLDMFEDEEDLPIELPRFKTTKLGEEDTQKAAIRELVDYCLRIGSWGTRKECKLWIQNKLRDLTC